jgi:putative membrane protein
MTDTPERQPRKPQAFRFEEPTETARSVRRPQAFETGVILTPETEDPFAASAAETLDALEPPSVRRRGLPLLAIFSGALGLILSVAFGLWLDGLISDLFARADWLGYAAIGVTAVGGLAAAGMAVRELIGLRRLASVQALKRDAEAAAADHRPVHARAVVARLVALSERIPETAAGRAAIARTEHEIIDADGLLRLAELELLEPADRKARQLVLSASKRVSVVTAVSPRAIVDLGYVLFEASRLIRAIAETYGTRPGRLGMIGLFRDVVAHLAVTGSIAVGDGIAQQILGHGLASKLSARLGEGVINGLMTARIGIAAMDLLRPLPFKAAKRPGVSDFLADLAPGASDR